MDFFENQALARRKSALLVAYYVLAVALITCGVYLAVAGTFLGVKTKTSGTLDLSSLWNASLFAWVTGSTLVIVLLGSMFKIAQLSGGGARVATLLGGRPVQAGTLDPDERKVLNVVQEMAIAAGLPIPPVFILPDEEGINAFAAGFSTDDAVVAVTRGCVAQLSRAELQGVVAHEFSHILNGDMRLNIRLMGVLHGIMIITMIGYGVMRSMLYTSGRSRSREKGGGNLPFVVLGLVLMIIGYVGVFFGKVIKSAVSRQREFLADASAVQFTRNPDGITGALKKIAGYARGSRLQNRHAEEASHLFFSNGLSQAFFNLLATHPPLEERIRRLDPSFTAEQAQRSTSGPVASPAQASPAAAAVSGFAASPATVAARVGMPRFEHLEHAAALMVGLPERMAAAARDAFGARAVVYALLLNDDAQVQARQLEHLERFTDEAVYKASLRLIPEAHGLRAEQRLPLADLAVASLRGLSETQFKQFRQNVEQLAVADERIDLFEYTLQRMILRRLEPLYTGARPDSIRHHTIKSITPWTGKLLSCLAHWGVTGRDAGAAEKAFEAGLRALGRSDAVAMLGPRECTLAGVDECLAELAAAAPALKRSIIEACTACIGSDGTVTVEEAELLRAVGDALGCPLPPFLPGQSV